MGETVSVKRRGGLLVDLQDPVTGVTNKDGREQLKESHGRDRVGGCGRDVQGTKKDERAQDQNLSLMNYRGQG